ncbi:MAG: hypothetical protein HYT27_03135 [Parcubacteria group bacterium]|nr:hypothetical protein [Parcubacteria group bacterium]
MVKFLHDLYEEKFQFIFILAFYVFAFGLVAIFISGSIKIGLFLAFLFLISMYISTLIAYVIEEKRIKNIKGGWLKVS